jgi:SAM-dependent methyltransferase
MEQTMEPSVDPDHREQIRAAVTARYSGLARAAQAGQPVIDCGPDAFDAGCFGAAGYDDTSELPDGAVRASLGCGNPVAVTGLQPGDTVLDLGSGGGIDVLLSARRVWPGGQAYGLDGSPDMIALARENAAHAGITNVEFLHGHIEDIPLADGTVDVVISNCVLNLSADKPRALAEAFRVLRPGGKLGISDIIASDGLDPAQQAQAEQAVGCTTGTLTAGEYRSLLLAAGFAATSVTAIQDPGNGLHSVIIRGRRPEAPPAGRMAPVTAASTSAPATYTAVCRRAGKWWEITVPELDEVTQARRLDDVPATVADLVALMTGADPASIRVDVKARAAGPGLDAAGWLRAAIGAAIVVAIIRRVIRA